MRVYWGQCSTIRGFLARHPSTPGFWLARSPRSAHAAITSCCMHYTRLGIEKSSGADACTRTVHNEYDVHSSRRLVENSTTKDWSIQHVGGDIPLVHVGSERVAWFSLIEIWYQLGDWPIKKVPLRYLKINCMRMRGVLSGGVIKPISGKEWLSLVSPSLYVFVPF